MTFQSRKDIVFQFIVFGFSTIFIGIVGLKFYKSGIENSVSLWSDIVLLAISGVLLWLYFGTKYELSKTDLKYKSGPIRGAIEIDQITEVISGQTLWSGFKPATARRGLIIKYNRYDQIYISPKTNDTFVNKLLELNSVIKITAKSNA
jgi:hypothetical protein